MKNLFLFLLMAAATTMISCKGEQGIPGPAGVAGQDGIDGQDGQDGTNGTNGNANVKSFKTTVYASDWLYVISSIRQARVNVPIITNTIANNGLVMVYSHNIGSTSWLAWPLSYAFNGGTRSFYYYVFSGGLDLYSEASAGSPFESGIEVRVVAATADGLARNPDLDWTNYEAVKSALGLED
ncbi:MAG: hypothetical protein R3A50_01030 [Saprospiraceae bacterium]